MENATVWVDLGGFFERRVKAQCVKEKVRRMV